VPEPSSDGTRAIRVVSAGAVFAALGVLVMALEPLHGAVLLVLTPQHGFDSGDLLAVPFFVVAAFLALTPSSPLVRTWNAAAQRSSGRSQRRAPLALVPIGVGLVVLGTLDRIWARVHPSDTTELAASLATVGVAVVAALLLARGSPVGRDRSVALGVVAAFAVGSLLDVAAQPKGTVLGATLVALLLTATVRGRPRALLWVASGVVLTVDLFALWSVRESDTVLAARGGASTRAIALGVVLVLYGVARFSMPRHATTGDLLHAA
jgi:hypothetical protein